MSRRQPSSNWISVWSQLEKDITAKVIRRRVAARLEEFPALTKQERPAVRKALLSVTTLSEHEADAVNRYAKTIAQGADAGSLSALLDALYSGADIIEATAA